MNGIALVTVDTSGRALAGVLGYVLNADRSPHATYAPTNLDGYVAPLPMPAGPFSGILVLAGAATYYEQPFSYTADGQNFTFRVGVSQIANPNDIQLPACSPFKRPLPNVPSREAVCNGQTTQQGFTVTTSQFGAMPWWGACWAWLSQADRAIAAQQLLNHGDTVCLIERPSGVPLYDESGNFYSPDKFPALSMSDAAFTALVEETLSYGFAAVWVFLGGDDGQAGYPIAVAQVEALAPVMGHLNAYACYFPGWDGVFYGYTPEQVAAFAAAARATGAQYVGVEGSTGHIPVGNGSADYEPGGLMEGYDVILGEFNDGQFDDTVWQVLPRMGRPYVRPPEQPSGDDPDPPFYLAQPSPRGPFYFRIFEYYIYGWVRGTPASVVTASRAQFQAMAPEAVIC